MSDSIHAGDLIRTARLARGISQARLGEMIGVSQPAVARLERSDNPRLDTVRRALHAVGMNLELRASPTGVGLDVSQLDRHLAMTPEERLRSHRAALQSVSSLVSRATRES